MEQRKGASVSRLRVASRHGNGAGRGLKPGSLESKVTGFTPVLTGLLIVLSSARLGGSVAAQVTPRTRLEGTSKGASLDRFLYDGTGETAFSFRLTELRPGTFGPDISVSMFPQALAASALVWATDFGAAYNISRPSMTILLKGGASALTGIASDILFVPGVHVGAGLIMRLDNHTGMRLDGVRHFYFEDGETEPIWSTGLGFCTLPALRSKSSEVTR